MNEDTDEDFTAMIRDGVPRKLSRSMRPFPKLNDESRPTFASLSQQHKFQQLKNFRMHTAGDDDDGENMSIYSGAGIKMEAFDCFHKVLNKCVSDFSFTIRDAAGVLKLLTPDIIKTILPLLLTVTIKKQSGQPNTPKKRDSQSDFGEEALDYEISEINKGQIERGEAEIVGCTMSKRPLAPRPPDSLDTTTRSSSPGSNSCSPVSAAVQALISISAPLTNNTMTQPMNSVKKLVHSESTEVCEVVEEDERAMFRSLSNQKRGEVIFNQSEPLSKQSSSRHTSRNLLPTHSMRDLSDSIHSAMLKSTIALTSGGKERKSEKKGCQETNETMIISSNSKANIAIPCKRPLQETNETMIMNDNEIRHSMAFPSNMSNTSVIMTSTAPDLISSSAHTTHNSIMNTSLLTTAHKSSAAYTTQNPLNATLLTTTQQVDNQYSSTNPPHLSCETYSKLHDSETLSAVSTTSLQTEFAQCKLSSSRTQTPAEPIDAQQSTLVHQNSDPMMNSYDLLLTTPGISDLPCGLQSPFNHQMPASPLPSMMNDSLETGSDSVTSTKHIPPLLPSITATSFNSGDLSTETTVLQTACMATSVSNPPPLAASINSALQPSLTNSSSAEISPYIEHPEENMVTDPQVITAAVRVQAPLRTILPKPPTDHPAVSMVSVLSLTNSASNSLSQVSPVIKIDDKRMQYGNSIPPNQIFTKIRPVATSVVMTVPTTPAAAAVTVSVAQPRQIFPNQVCYFAAQGIDSFIFPQSQGKEPLKNFFAINSQNLVTQQLNKAKTDNPRPPTSDNEFKASGNLGSADLVTVSSGPTNFSSNNLTQTNLGPANLGPTILKAENPVGGNLEVASALLSMASEKESSGSKVEEGHREEDVEENSEMGDGEVSFRKIILESLQEETSNIQVVFTNTGTVKIKDVEINPLEHGIKKGSFTCGKCQHMFTSVLYLTRHIKRVCPDMSQRKWKCDRCSKAFRHPFGLQQHIYTHTGERPHKCTQCPKAFYSSNDLRRHARTHSGERPYQCSICEKAFSTTISLKTHQYIHTGERPHKCPHCPKTFATSSKLSRHVVTHSEKRPFPCDQCAKTFNRSGDLRRHYNQQHGNPHALLECNHCNKVFATHKCLLNHQATHNRDVEKNPGPVSTTTTNENSYFEQLKYNGVAST